MRLQTTVRYLAIGLSALRIPFVQVKDTKNAALGYMTIKDFETWVHSNEGAFVTIGEDLRWLIYLSQVERPLFVDAAPDADSSKSLDETLAKVQEVFQELEVRAERREDEAGAIIQKADPNRNHFFSTEIENISSMIFEFNINLPRGVWQNRINDELVEAKTTIEATKELVQQLEDSRLDLTDPVAVAMWVLDAQDIVNQGASEITIISFNVGSLQKLRQAFKAIYDGYRSIAEVIARVYKEATNRYQDAIDKEPLFAIETPLRRLQNLVFAYQGVFSDKPTLKFPVRKTS
ncbi:hypothetical protein TWF481_012214 [Arthrobotrys musiformis]|uniref:Uncharacterized protein n=1 Tax=Arthrobotrys musiformis TaxID=47236 RepID=A0AAV9VXV8_9PEZI